MSARTIDKLLIAFVVLLFVVMLLLFADPGHAVGGLR